MRKFIVRISGCITFMSLVIFIIYAWKIPTGTIMRCLPQLRILGTSPMEILGNQVDSDMISCPIVSLSAKLLPLTVLVSFPGSGNTWTRHLLEQMTGIATGSDYYDKSLEQGGFIGEVKMDGSVIAIKTHATYPPQFLHQHPIQRAILIIRNPYEAMLADFHRHYSKNHVGMVSLTVFMKGWSGYFSKWSSYWYTLNHSWITNMKKIVVLFYENLKTDLRQELSRLDLFLRQDGYQGGNIQCALRKPEGNFHRNESDKLPPRFFYEKRQVLFLNKEIDKMTTLLSKYNHSKNDVSTYKLKVL